VDSTASGARDAGRLTELLRTIVEFESIDVLFYVLGLTTPHAIADRLAPVLAVHRATSKPLIVFCHYYPSPEAVDELAANEVIWYASQSGAARGVRALAERGRAGERGRSAAHGRGGLDGLGGYRLGSGDLASESALKSALAARGLPVPAGILAASAREAGEAFDRLGAPVALKIQVAGLHHKSDIGGVLLGIDSRAAVEAAFGRLAALRPDDDVKVLVEQMTLPGREMLVGGLVDPDLGPFLILGTGGVDADLGLDKVIRPAPLDRADALDMVRALPSAAALGPWRGAPARDVDALADLLVAVSRVLVASAADVRELELNPVIVHADRAALHIVDALAIPADTVSQTGSA
jgi:acyl-CoA synthetase (NDP forming)